MCSGKVTMDFRANVYNVQVDKQAVPCEIRVLSVSNPRTIRLGQSSSGTHVVPIMSREDLTAPGAVVTDSPHAITSVAAVESAFEPPWVSARSRSLEEVDILSEADRAVARLGEGWAPREMVAGAPVRWVGSVASLELDPSAQLKTLMVSGTIGPCLGWGASVSLLASGAEVANHQFHLEDGQPFVIEFNLDGVPLDNGVVMKINRPQPRFTPHDARTLNLLVRAVEVS